MKDNSNHLRTAKIMTRLNLMTWLMAPALPNDQLSRARRTQG